jgi:hypothetical protein
MMIFRKAALFFVVLMCVFLVLTSCKGASKTGPVRDSNQENTKETYPNPEEANLAYPIGDPYPFSEGTYPYPIDEVGSYPSPQTDEMDRMYPEPGADVNTETGTLSPEPSATPTIAKNIPGSRIVDADLRASDPSTFTIASGKVQLVEFFAFW